MKMKFLLGMLAGVLISTVFTYTIHDAGMNRQWEWRAWNHGCGRFDFKILDTSDWDGGPRLHFHWYDEQSGAKVITPIDKSKKNNKLITI